jgi:hypothetical protein
MKLLITTQVYENYAIREDGSVGTGADAYWKAKGGSEYVVKNFKDAKRMTEVLMALRGKIETDNDYFREYIVNFEIVADDYLTEFERSQLEYDGEIAFPARELELS